MNQLVLPAEVLAQIGQIHSWYETHGEHLADDFLNELERTLKLLRDNPQIYAIAFNHTRRARLHRFPYKVYYRIHGQRITVVSIIHDMRRQERW